MGKHILVSYADFNQSTEHLMAIVVSYCESFCIDNGAYTIWNQGGSLDIEGYKAWCFKWRRSPAFDFCIVPDVIGGSQKDNEKLLDAWPLYEIRSAPVWHMNESTEYLDLLVEHCTTVCIGTAGIAHPGTRKWWKRMSEAMRVACDKEGSPGSATLPASGPARLHGLGMLDWEIYSRIPFACADSANAVINRNSKERFGYYCMPSEADRATAIAYCSQRSSSAPFWHPSNNPYFAGESQEELFKLN